MIRCDRVLTGVGIGAVSMVAPLYVAEVVAASRRGPLGTAFQLLVTVGVFASYGIGSVVSWSWLAVTGAALCCIHALLLLAVPETPRWLLSTNDQQAIYSDKQHIHTHRHHLDTHTHTDGQHLDIQCHSGRSVLFFVSVLCHSD